MVYDWLTEFNEIESRWQRNSDNIIKTVEIYQIIQYSSNNYLRLISK